jgi:hypothetical protein
METIDPVPERPRLSELYSRVASGKRQGVAEDPAAFANVEAQAHRVGKEAISCGSR